MEKNTDLLPEIVKANIDLNRWDGLHNKKSYLMAGCGWGAVISEAEHELHLKGELVITSKKDYLPNKVKLEIDLNRWDGKFTMRSYLEAGCSLNTVMPFIPVKKRKEVLKAEMEIDISALDEIIYKRIYGEDDFSRIYGWMVGEFNKFLIETTPGLDPYKDRWEDKDWIKWVANNQSLKTPEAWIEDIKISGGGPWDHGGDGISKGEYWVLLDWISRKKHKLLKTQKIKLHNEFEVPWQNHRIINIVSVDDLNQRGTTSYYKLFEKYRPEIVRRLEEIYRKKEEFPICEYCHLIPSNWTYISDSWALLEEGEKMDNCVGEYIDECIPGNLYIFHIDDETEFGATLGIAYNPNSKNKQECYYQTQLYGRGNDNVSLNLLEKVRKIIRKINQKWYSIQ